LDDLVQYRIDIAKEKLKSAKILLDAGQYKDSIGRSYYALFSAVRAVLAKDQVDFSKHAGVIAYFQKNYIKTERFERKYSKYLTSAFQIRNSCDYDDFYIVSKANAEEQYRKVDEMIHVIIDYLCKSEEQ
jgi:HEPN domain protein